MDMKKKSKCGENKYGVPKRAFLSQEKASRYFALRSSGPYYAQKDGTLLTRGQTPTPDDIVLTEDDLREDIVDIEMFEQELDKPVNQGYVQVGCCPLGRVLLKC